MIALIASIVGFISSIVPEIIKLLQEKSKGVHNISMLTKQAKLARRSQELNLKKMEFLRDYMEQNNMYKTYTTGIRWIDGFNGSVRPVLAYSFFFLYATVKIIQYRQLANHSNLVECANILWNSNDQAIFAGIISFYFGQRTFSKINK